MKCIVGLGNPGKKYALTRHNIGFMAVDELAQRNSFSLDKSKFKCSYGIDIINGEKTMLVKPETFMNLSGEGVRPLIDYYGIKIEDIAVIFDDLDLPVGKLRLREKGGHGGHNGIRSLITHLGTKEFKRIRLGIGRPASGMQVVDYVLQSFSKTELPDVLDIIDRAAAACEDWLDKPFHEVMNEFNR